MSTSASRTKTIVIVAIATLAGFAAVYGTIMRPDNAPSETVSTTASGSPETPAPKAATETTGQMAAFVKKKVPEALADIEFQDASGATIKLSSFKGRTVLLNLWATWCAPCREEMPALNRLQAALGSDKFEVVALSLDRQGAEASKKFLDEVGASALKLYVDSTARQGGALRIVGMPTTILINSEGLEVGRLPGPAEWDSMEARKLIEATMISPPPNQ